MNSRCRELCEYIDSLPIVSTHEHHRPFDKWEEPVTLEFLFRSGYVAWNILPPQTPEDRPRFLEMMCGNSYFIWLEKALDDLFDFGGEITPKNWDAISGQVSAAFTDPVFQERVFHDKCLYKRAILDAYWKPGDDNGRPDLYTTTLRMNSFVFGRTLESRDHNGNNAQVLYGKCSESSPRPCCEAEGLPGAEPKGEGSGVRVSGSSDLDQYLAMMDSTVANAKANGTVALKSALAYDRPLNFQPVDKADASRIFNKEKCTFEEETIFQDYIYGQICRLAAKYSLPFQNHVGLGKLPGTNPINLVPMIEANPETNFVLFHMGYPWVEEVCAISHNYGNVFPDLCWMPSIGTTTAVRALHSIIETVRDSSKVCWGGDSWLVTESYAASLAIRSVLKQVLCEKIESNYLTIPRARLWAEKILYRNAEVLYGI